MNKRLIAGMLVLLVLMGGMLFFITEDALAGWTQPKGHAYTQLTYAYYVADERYVTAKPVGPTAVYYDTPRLVDVPKFETRTVTFYGEYGIIDPLTVILSVPYKWTRSQDVVNATGERGPNGLSDIEIGLRYNILKSLMGGPFSVQWKVKIPEAYEYKDPLTYLNLGDGQYDTELALMYGRGLGKGYAILTLGYNYRFPNTKFYTFKPSDQLRLMLGGGYSITPKFSLRGLLNYTRSVGNAKVSDGMRKDAILKGQIGSETQDNILIREVLGLEPEFITLSGDLVYNINPKMQTVFTYTAETRGIGVFRTRNANIGEGVSVALVYMY